MRAQGDPKTIVSFVLFIISSYRFELEHYAMPLLLGFVV